MILKVLSVFGTRPEAIKMAPVVKELEQHPETFRSLVCVTGQHREMLDQVLSLFGIEPDYDLDVMRPGQDLFDITCQVLQCLKHVLARERPDVILVHGDTSTTMAATIAAYYSGMKVGHVEAGLRSHNKMVPFPEEMNRRITTVVADLHFAPTEAARQNLLREGVDDSVIFVTGNTVIDALLSACRAIEHDPALDRRLAEAFSFLDPQKRLILVTGHRRENFGAGFESICHALADLALRNEDIEILYPVHMNPFVQEPVRRILGGPGFGNVHIVEPVDYLSFVYLMKRAYLVITDSGGVLEEAPSLGKPVLVMREVCERPEALLAGNVKLVGTDATLLVNEAMVLLHESEVYRNMSLTSNPYGDGFAARRIREALISIFGYPVSRG